MHLIKCVRRFKVNTYEHIITLVTGKMPLFQNHLRDSKDFSILEDSHVRVEFANPKELFYAGEHLVGKVIVSLGRAIRCEKMTMQYTGYSDVSWETREGDRIKTHRNEDEYFNASTVLLAPQPPDEHVTIPQGELTYPFEFNLPAHLPPAMITPHGKVVYYIAVGIVGIVSEVQGSTKARKKKYKFSKSNLVSGISLKVSRRATTAKILPTWRYSLIF